MSHGALTRDSHQTIAAAFNELDGFSNHVLVTTPGSTQFKAIDKAMDSNKRGRKLRGASTISQQLAKNLFLWQGRSYVRKALEAWYTEV